MDIHKILYNTTRNILNVEDKLSIATIFIFCNKIGSEKFAELLYTKDHKKFVKQLNKEYAHYEVIFHLNLFNKNINNCFMKTLDEVKLKYDNNGFYKAVFEKDPYAMVICDMVKDNLFIK